MFRQVIDAFARGEIVVVTDDDDRENEGDLILAAAHTTPEKMAFIIRNTCGIVCAPLTGEIARRLHLAPMVADSDAIHGTAFTVSVDYRHGTTTGISAEDRTATIRNLANGNAGRADFVRPGHIFPLIAKDGGVLMRSGHTEAAIDLCRLAELEPVAAICELVNDDGTVMRGPQVAAFAEKHRLKRISVADLIAYRQAREKLVTRVAEFTVATEIGELTGYAYVTPFDKVHHYAFVYGKIGDGSNLPTRLHRANVLEDVFGGAKPIHAALSRFKAAGRGVLVYLRDGTSGVPTIDRRRRERPARSTSAARNGAKSGSARRSCATCGSPRSSCLRPARAPMSGSPASASRSPRPSRWKRKTMRIGQAALRLGHRWSDLPRLVADRRDPRRARHADRAARERNFSWSRSTISFAIGINLLLYGLVGPFAAVLIDRFGVRRTVVAALAVTAAAVALTPAMHEAWQLLLLGASSSARAAA